MIHTNKRLVLGLSAAAVMFASSLASADGKPYPEGNVVNVAAIRTEYGHFEDYLKFLAGDWKKEMEAEKAAGLIVSYEVLAAEPRGPNDADIYLVITYKNWAALDGFGDKADAIATKTYGSVAKSNEGMADRGKIRRALGSETVQVLNLK
jgi:hypothetical protein